NNNVEKPLVKIFWTGGYDSTFRMVQLSRSDLTIQPYYLCDDQRCSEKNELKAITTITADIEKHPETKCTILPLLKFRIDAFKPDKSICEAYGRLHKLTSIGPQYQWLAEFAKTNQGIELCLEKAGNGRAYNCIRNYGAIKRMKEGDLLYGVIDPEQSNEDLIRIFGNFHLPLPLFETTKLEMREEYIGMGFGETMYRTWFCHTPVKNEPCGVCNPCKAVVEEGLAFRISSAGMKRYRTEMKFGNYFWFKFLKKIRHRLVRY
ncbi:MAG: hypothetical protein WAL29_05720, partial [Bacteroidales bacterium]